MKVAIGSDHGGFALKETIVRHLKEQGITVEDFGTYSTESCDYPIFAKKAAEAVANGECEKGIVVCTTGIGVSMVANKVKGIRCAVCTDPTVARMTRLHNDANMIALGGGIIGELIATDIVDTFLNTPFSEEEKHIRRVGMIETE
ncbi:MAG: ribose 5-phosphate isomerase B [Lachnospiraceae bacterium]|nr:ribose 5-phosphate isomerase B [Lachnospiraceae bacterium]